MTVDTHRPESPGPEAAAAAPPAPVPDTVPEHPALTRERVLADYRLSVRSREASLLGRKEVLTGKAKFGIFGDGKEVAQLAMAQAFRPGDFRSGYYRDQTVTMALGLLTVEQFFAQLYADPDPEREPHSAGRQMNAHFASPLVDAQGEWLDLAERPNIAADLSPTASQMPRLAGLAYALDLMMTHADPNGALKQAVGLGAFIVAGLVTVAIIR